MGPAEESPPPPSTSPTVAVPLLALNVYLSSLTLVMEYPLAPSRIDEEKPSKGATERNLTVSPVLLPCPGSSTVITAEPLLPERNALKERRTVTAGSVLSGRGVLSG